MGSPTVYSQGSIIHRLGTTVFSVTYWKGSTLWEYKHEMVLFFSSLDFPSLNSLEKCHNFIVSFSYYAFHWISNLNHKIIPTSSFSLSLGRLEETSSEKPPLPPLQGQLLWCFGTGLRERKGMHMSALSWASPPSGPCVWSVLAVCNNSNVVLLTCLSFRRPCRTSLLQNSLTQDTQLQPQLFLIGDLPTTS